MASAPSGSHYEPRICVCVMMNHPFPRNIPIIRRLYRGRFSKVVFVMPFERMDDPDVFTVYRGSYSHAAYITDIREKLAAFECDYFMFVHDDVLLNPALSEATFFDTFPLAPDDGFIAVADQPGEHIGYQPWYPGVVAKLLFPKSRIWGNGMDAASLIKYMPPIARMREKLDAAGVGYVERVKLDQDDSAWVMAEASRVLLHGHAIDLGLSPNAVANSEPCIAILRQLIDAMALGLEAEPPSGRLQRGLSDDGRDVVLPFPLVHSGAYTDFYILPRSKLSDYAHYMGVWSGTGALIEFAVATLLHVCCDKVWTAKQLGLEFSFFADKNTVGYFHDPKFIGIHPYKFSEFRDRASQDNFFAAIDGLVQGDAWPQYAEPGRGYRLGDLIGDYAALGWFPFEGWGRWSGRERAEIVFRTRPEQPISAIVLRLRTPTHERFTGSVGVKGRSATTPVVIAENGFEVEVRIDGGALDPNGENVVEITADRTIRPADATGGIGDSRTLGFGLAGFAFV